MKISSTYTYQIIPFQDAIFALTGAVFYLAAAGVVLDHGKSDAAKGLGSMCIFCAAVFVVDVVFALVNLKKTT